MTRVARYVGVGLAAALTLSNAHAGLHATTAVTQLRPGTPISGEISGRAIQSFPITLTDGQYARVVVEHHGVAIVVRLVDAAEVVQIEKRSEEIDGQDVLEFASETTADFQIRVATRFPKAEAGTYRIAIGELRAAGERDYLLYEASRYHAESVRVFQSGAYRDAQAAAERALEIRERLLGQDHADVAASLDWVGLIYAARNQYAKADELHRRALAINERVFGPHHPAVADVLESLAKNARSKGSFEEADRLATKAVGIRTGRFGTNHPMIVSSLGVLSDVYVAKSDYRAAEKVSDQALDIVATAYGSDDQTYADFAVRASRPKLFLGNYARAEELALLALRTTEQAGPPDRPLVGVMVATLAGVYMYKGDNVKAEQTFQRALAIYRKSFGNDHVTVSQIFNNLGLLAFRRGDDESAESYFAQALEIRERLTSPSDPIVGAILNNMGRLYHKKRDYTKAAEFYRRSLAISENSFGSGSTEVTAALVNLGIIAKETGDYDRAETYYRRSLSIREKEFGPNHPEVGSIVDSLAILYRDKGDYESAEPMFLRSLAITERSLGLDHPTVARNLTNLAQLYSARGDVANARQTLQRIVAVQEKNLPLNLAAGSERQKLAYFGPFGATLEKTISFQVREDPASAEARDLAATALLQRKGRVLDAMADSLNALRHRSDTADVELLDKLGSVTSQLAGLVLNGPQRLPLAEHQQRIKALSQQRESLEIDVSRRSAGYYERSNPATLAAVQAAIPAEAALLEFAVYRPFDPRIAGEQTRNLADSRYVAYVVRRNRDIRWKELGPAREIDETVANLRLGLRDPQNAEVKRWARALDEKVLQPLREMTGDATRLLISPDGQLALVPFEALVDEDGRYLVERYSISYLTTGRDLLRLQVPRPSRSEPLIVANPLFGEPAAAVTTATNALPATVRIARRSIVSADNLADVYFAPLAGTGLEARTIKSLFPEARLLIGAEATKAALARAEAPRILHIATHGFFLSKTDAVENPLIRSGLALTGANEKREDQDGGILTALEASNLNLWGTKLVTLSACDTGLGDVTTGEGVYGLRRAFFLAGAETLVMSLWPVSDYVTREMMTTYYAGLKRGLGRGDALRQAQLAVFARSGRQHPFYWASFIQAGEWANLDGRR